MKITVGQNQITINYKFIYFSLQQPQYLKKIKYFFYCGNNYVSKPSWQPHEQDWMHLRLKFH